MRAVEAAGTGERRIWMILSEAVPLVENLKASGRDDGLEDQRLPFIKDTWGQGELYSYIWTQKVCKMMAVSV